MMQAQNHLKTLLVFALLAISSYAWYEFQFAAESQWQFKPFTKGYALFDSEVQITDEAGVIQTTIVSPEMIYFADSEQTMIKQPVVQYRVNDVVWHLKSAEANINSDQTEILFPNEVSMASLDEQNKATLNTRNLTLYPEQEKARTAAQIKWQQAAITMTGIGSVIDLNLQEIEVLDEMHAEINP